ncbi:DUF3566 domain-containing protein [Kribbella sp. NPDC051718]|uniref:DUF3566 domain-containing protein n=1 Tax=Kribbella sp. NPDC051718 TaxID=3155168 RepID=UPI00341E7572
MTNRARPTWPDGADSPNPQRPQNGAGKGQSTPPATPASNGRSSSTGNGQTRSGTANGQRPGDARQPRPGGPSATPSSAGTPSRPPQQPPVRPAATPSNAGAGTARPGAVSGRPAATPFPANPSTPGRPEPRLPSSGKLGDGGGSAYGQTGKLATPTHTPTESFSDKLNAAKQAVLGRASALKDSATSVTSGALGTQTAEPKAKIEQREDFTPAVEAAPKTSGRPQTRKARLRLTRLDPWSVMKTAFLLSIAFGIVTWVAVFIIWSAIGAAGVFDNINNTVREVLGNQEGADPFQIEDYINTGKVMGFTTLLACADVLIITALATLGSFLYNIAATLLGGLEVTLASED